MENGKQPDLISSHLTISCHEAVEEVGNQGNDDGDFTRDSEAETIVQAQLKLKFKLKLTLIIVSSHPSIAHHSQESRDSTPR
jgi:hypothetical protein